MGFNRIFFNHLFNQLRRRFFDGYFDGALRRWFISNNFVARLINNLIGRLLNHFEFFANFVLRLLHKFGRGLWF